MPGSSDPIDGATDTLLAGAGVCRDYAHLVIALLRALGVPARLAAVYAPGCQPMDFHAVAVAFVDGGWRVVDATCLAPRQTMVRIATGRDATDTAFLDNHEGAITLKSVTVTAVVDGELPKDSVDQLVSSRRFVRAHATGSSSTRLLYMSETLRLKAIDRHTPGTAEAREG